MTLLFQLPTSGILVLDLPVTQKVDAKKLDFKNEPCLKLTFFIPRVFSCFPLSCILMTGAFWLSETE